MGPFPMYVPAPPPPRQQLNPQRNIISVEDTIHLITQAKPVRLTIGFAAAAAAEAVC